MAEKETKDREQTRYASRGSGRTSYGEGRNTPAVRRNENGGALATTSSPFGLMRRVMEDMDRMFEPFGSFAGGEGMVCKFKGKGRLWCQTHQPRALGTTLTPMLKPVSA